MRSVDEVRGFEREIKVAVDGGYITGGGVPLTNCVIEVVPNDWQGRCPMLSLRFFHVPIPHRIAEQSADAGNPLYDAETATGVEVNLGPEIARSLVEQLQAKWPEYVQMVNDAGATQANE
jgi:hypothetical protein